MRFADLSGLLVALEDRAHRIGADHLDLLVHLLEIAPGARDRAARPHAGHEVRDAPLGLLPQLGTRAAVVRLRVRGVVVLVHEHRSRALAGDAPRHVVVAVGMLGRDRRGAQVDLGAERLQQIHFLARDLVGHAERGAVALDRRDHGEPEPGIA